MRNAWKGLIIGAFTGAGIGVLLDGGSSAGRGAAAAAKAARDHAPEALRKARELAETAADKAREQGPEALKKAKELADAAAERAGVSS
jgi:hypothetical protein